MVDVYIKMCIEAVSWHVGLHQPLPHKKDGDLLVQVQRRAVNVIWRRKGWSTSPVKKDWQSWGCTAWSREGAKVTLQHLLTPKGATRELRGSFDQGMQ